MSKESYLPSTELEALVEIMQLLKVVVKYILMQIPQEIVDTSTLKSVDRVITEEAPK